jgi:phenylpyruvate tautomerase PptA (4-oxalocrotonate tautomerase family)
MPLVSMTLHAGRDAATIAAMLDAVHESLVEAGVPRNDRFQRVLEASPGAFHYDPHYPELSKPRDAGFVLIEILWSVGRSVSIKRALAERIATRVSAATSMDAQNVMLVFIETAWENWAFAGGTLLHAG